MNFVSATFVVFLILTVALFHASPPALRRPLLLVASYVFYASWRPTYVLLILFSTSIDYFLSRHIDRHRGTFLAKAAMIAGITANLAILIFFKYANFLLENVAGLLPIQNDALAPLDIILPLGISFFTFEAISYIVDVYKGMPPARSWLAYNFFIMYFPHLISGPIIRFKEIYPQYANGLALPSLARSSKAIELIVLGFVYKIMIADQAAGFADALFKQPDAATAAGAWLGTLAFTVQIYFDFMGYTHIARGVSLFFDIELPLNFDAPYLATSISDFWQRWHITLSRWIRDYIYIPLGGSRISLPRTVLNLMITMLLAGAWHGAGWAFILWGGYHGLHLSLNHLVRRYRSVIAVAETWTGPSLFHALSVAVTFLLVVLGWVLFRSPDLHTALAVYLKLFDVSDLVRGASEGIATGRVQNGLRIAILLLCCFAEPVVLRLRAALFDSMPILSRSVLVSGLILLCVVFSSGDSRTFIYFQF